MKNRIRLKNSLQEVQERLKELGYGPSDIEEFVSPAEDLVVSGRFLDITSSGLAIYLAQDFSRAFRLPYSPDKTVAVGSQFQIKQLMPVSMAELRF